MLCLLVACKKDTREQAIEILDDTSLATPDALAKAAALYYPKAKVWAEGADANWRLFVVVDRTNKPAIVKRGNDRVITFYDSSGADDIMNDGLLLGLGEKRGVGEVLVANRYHADTDGRDIKVLSVRRTVHAGDNGVQILSNWAPEDLEKARPYDMMMYEKSLVLPGGP